jgi:hypothetical protein
LTHRYVDSNAVGAGTGADWANAYTTLAAALTADAAGDNIWVAQDHAETQASAMTMTSSGTPASPVTIICANKAGSVPPVRADWRTTASVSTTGANAITINGTFYCYGIAFNSGTSGTNVTMSLTNTSGNVQHYDSCKLKNGTATNPKILLGPASGALTILENTTVEFGGTSGGLEVGGELIWRDTPSAIAGTPPSTLFTKVFRANNIKVSCEGLDLSAVSGTLVGATSTPDRVEFIGCDLHASVTVAATPTGIAAVVDAIRCDTANNQRHERIGYAGSQFRETTVVRTGGASDGSNSEAWRIVTTANSELLFPFRGMPITILNETVGQPLDIKMHGIWGGGAVPDNDEIWFDVDYFGSAGSPVLSRASGRMSDPFGTPTALDADSQTWGGGTTDFSQTITVTPQQKGPITIWPNAALPSTTFYVCPKPDITNIAMDKTWISRFAGMIAQSAGKHVWPSGNLGV